MATMYILVYYTMSYLCFSISYVHETIVSSSTLLHAVQYNISQHCVVHYIMLYSSIVYYSMAYCSPGAHLERAGGGLRRAAGAAQHIVVYPIILLSVGLRVQYSCWSTSIVQLSFYEYNIYIYIYIHAQLTQVSLAYSSLGAVAAGGARRALGAAGGRGSPGHQGFQGYDFRLFYESF